MNFNGEYHVSVDAKGRISVPSEFRAELSDVYSSDSLVVTRIKDGLIAYPPAQWEKIRQNVLNMPAGVSRDTAMRARIAPAKECSFNAQGRIQIPQSLRESRNIDGEAVVVGVLDKIEIWSREAYLNKIAEDEVVLEADPQLLADLGF